MRKLKFCELLIDRFIHADPESRLMILECLIYAQTEPSHSKEWAETLSEAIFPELIGELRVCD